MPGAFSASPPRHSSPHLHKLSWYLHYLGLLDLPDLQLSDLLCYTAYHMTIKRKQIKKNLHCWCFASRKSLFTLNPIPRDNTTQYWLWFLQQWNSNWNIFCEMRIQCLALITHWFLVLIFLVFTSHYTEEHDHLEIFLKLFLETTVCHKNVCSTW